MARTATVIPATASVNQEAVKQEGLQVLEPLAHSVDGLEVITPADYHRADQVLHRIKAARKTWSDRMEKIIRPIRQGLDELYGLNREVDKPLEALEETVKSRMKSFKVEELRQLRAAEAERERETARLRREAEEKAAAALKATTAQMKGRLQAAATRMVQQAMVVEQQETPAPTIAESSTTRPVQKVRIANLTHFIQGIVDGYVPEDCIDNPKVLDALQSKLNAYFKADAEGMKAWPGVEVYEDVQIVGR